MGTIILHARVGEPGKLPSLVFEFAAASSRKPGSNAPVDQSSTTLADMPSPEKRDSDPPGSSVLSSCAGAHDSQSVGCDVARQQLTGHADEQVTQAVAGHCAKDDGANMPDGKLLQSL